MIPRMSVRVVSSRTLKGSKWADKYPEKADDLWVFAIIDGKRRSKRIGPDTEENRVRAERKRREWEVLLERKALGEKFELLPTFSEAVKDFARNGMVKHAWKTRVRA